MKNSTSQKKPFKAYGYVRVSTRDQVEEGLSIDAQKAKIEAFTTLHDLDLINIFIDEGYSGKDLNRPAIQKLLQLVKNQEAEAVVVYKLDRLSRTTTDLLLLIENTFHQGNTRFLSISEQIDTETAMGKFFLTMMAGLAQMERELIAERTRATLAHKKQKGQYLGHIPYGFQLNEKEELIKNEEEQKVIKKMKRWRREGLSYQKIADLLNKQGVLTHKKETKWHKSSVWCVLN